MPQSEPTIRSNVLTPLRGYMAKERVDFDALIGAVGLTSDQVGRPECWISLNAVCRLFELAAVRCSDPGFGLHYAVEFPRGGTGLIAHVVLTAPTVRHALKALADYIKLHNSMPAEYVENEGVGRFRLGWPTSLTAPRLQVTDFAVALIVIRIRMVVGPGWRPSKVEFDHRRPADVREYHRVLGPNLHFDKPTNEIVFDPTTLGQPLPESIKDLHQSVRDLADLRLKQDCPQGDIAEQTRAVLSGRLGSDLPFDLDAVAKALAIQPRSLQWQLDQHQTTYERLLSETRREIAERLLRDSDMSLTEIAGKLSFSELSAFTRAAQRWFGMAPRLYRQKLRRGDETEPEQDG